VPRIYRLQRRAERQEETRQRIVEAAVELHTSIGPASTSVSAIAQRAGVQRHTFYRHFPDERSLGLACSGLFHEQHPPPDPGPLLEIADAEARLRRGIGEMYGYYERNADALGPIIRDAETHQLTKEILELRFKGPFEALCGALADGFHERGETRRRVMAALAVFLGFNGWRALRSGVRSSSEAVNVAVRGVMAQSSVESHAPAPD
jgi:AcrR family transcriptional regulator